MVNLVKEELTIPKKLINLLKSEKYFIERSCTYICMYLYDMYALDVVMKNRRWNIN